MQEATIHYGKPLRGSPTPLGATCIKEAVSDLASLGVSHELQQSSQWCTPWCPFKPRGTCAICCAVTSIQAMQDQLVQLLQLC